MHYALEVGIVLRGRVQRTVEQTAVEFGPGDVWFHGPWEMHGVRTVHAPREVVHCLVWPPFLTELRLVPKPKIPWLTPFQGPFDTRPRVPAGRRGEVIKIARRLLACADKEPDDQMRVCLALIELLLVVFDGCNPFPGGPERPPMAAGSIAPAVVLVLHTPGIVHVNAAARSCGMGRSKFMATFSALMRISFGEFCQRQRLRRAAAQLAATDLPIKSVAREMGFTTVPHFDHTFLKFYGCTPTRYRQLGRSAAGQRKDA